MRGMLMYKLQWEPIYLYLEKCLEYFDSGIQPTPIIIIICLPQRKLHIAIYEQYINTWSINADKNDHKQLIVNTK